MKTITNKLFFAVAVIFVLGACSTTKQLEGNQIVPSAQGEVTTRKEGIGNTRVTLNVKHLAPAGKVVEGANNYVVWVKAIGATKFTNIGALKVDKNLQGSYTTTIPQSAFRIMVTPEASVAAVVPTGPVIFEDIVQR